MSDIQRQDERKETKDKIEPSTAWFTFGQSHAHSIGDVTLDKDCVVKITAPDPRERMFELFGAKWSMQYDKEPNMDYYPRGVFEL